MYPAPSPAVARPRPGRRLAETPGVQLVCERPPRKRRPLVPAAAAGLDFSGARGERLRAALSGVHEICPDFSTVQVLRDGPSVVLLGMAGRRAVVAKCLPTPAGAPAERLRQEILAHRSFVRLRPPVRVPRLVADDPQGCVLVTEFVPGRMAGARRHAAALHSAAELRAALAAFGRLNSWRPRGLFREMVNYPAQLARYHELGLLTDRDVSDLHTLLHGLCPRGQELPRQFCHGAATPGSVLFSPTGPVLIGWAAAGWYLPGHDLATLWTALADLPRARRLITQLAHAQGQPGRDAFLVNLLLVLTREIRRCEEAVQRAMQQPETAPVGGLAQGEEHRLRLRRLHEDWALARRAVRTAVGTR